MFPGTWDALARRYQDEISSGGSGIDQAQALGKYGSMGALLNPAQTYNQWSDLYNQDPRTQQGWGQYNQAYGNLSGAAAGYQDYANNFLNKDMRALEGQAYGRYKDAKGHWQNVESYADKYGAAQRQQAQGDIAKQAAMNARGGMSAADRRNAIMQSSGVGANMASQIAAARTQERQQAMMQYLQAQEMQRNARLSGTTMMGNVTDAAGNYVGAANQTFGGIGGAATTTTSQMGNAFWPGPK